MWAICKKEWAQYFNGLTGYLVIGFYLIVNGLVLFVLPNFNVLDFGYASLQAYFDFAPWFLLLLVPAITMHSFSDEYKQGTYEIIRTLPISPLQLVVGKFLGNLFIVLVAILPTLLYAFTLDALSDVGGIDFGATYGSYFGLLFLAACYTAIGIYISSITKNNLVSLLVSILVCILLFKGFNVLGQLSVFTNGANFYISKLGLEAHYINMSKGLLTAEDIIYFLSILVLFAIGSMENIKGKVKYIITVAVLISSNIFFSFYNFQLDLTKEQRYTLHGSTTEIIAAINKPARVHLYLGGDIPPYYKNIAVATADLLERFKQINPKAISWAIEVPGELYKDDALYQFYDSLSKLGLPIQRIQTENGPSDKRVDQLMIPGALIEVEGQAPIVIDLRTSKKYFKPYNIVKDIPEEDMEATANAAVSLLEYKFTQALYLLNRKVVPNIAYLTGNGEPVNLTVNHLGESIMHSYNLAVFDLKKGFPNPQKIKTLLIVKPTQAFTELDKLKLDQFVMGGGNIVWALDKLVAEYDSLQKTTGAYTAYDRSLALDDLLFKYGVRINANLVQDLNCAKLPMVVGKGEDGSPLIQRMPWPYFPFLQGNELHPIVQNIDRVLSYFPSSIDTIAVAGIQKTILLSTDSNSRILSSPALVDINSGKQEGELESFQKNHLPVAVLLEGKFPSLFSNRLSTVMLDSIKASTRNSFLAKGIALSKQVILSDADILTNQVDVKRGPLPMGMMPYEEYQFANHDFFVNTIAYLNEPTSLLASRSKQQVLRLLNRQKVEEHRVLVQFILVLGPLVLLGLFYLIWTGYRKRQFAI
jgi:gliding-associated putative ABC transporter substrate-binding component GldG/gliding motility-associated ABC transporter permease protein GldF